MFIPQVGGIPGGSVLTATGFASHSNRGQPLSMASGETSWLCKGTTIGMARADRNMTPLRASVAVPGSPVSLRLLQKPYFPLGSLRAQMLYPQSEGESPTPDAVLEEHLGAVQLGYLSSRYGSIHVTRNWQDELSLGEQQVWLLYPVLCHRFGA